MYLTNQKCLIYVIFNIYISSIILMSNYNARTSMYVENALTSKMTCISVPMAGRVKPDQSH